MGTLNDILQAAHVGETSDWEFKSAAGGLPGSLWETYSAMANTEGGTIVLGASEKNGSVKLDGLSTELADRYRRDIWSALNNRGKVSVNLLQEADVEVVPLGAARLLAIHVPRASRGQRPVYLKAQPFGNTYRRGHEGDFHCTEEEVRRMFADAEETPADYRVLTGFGLGDLDPVSLTQYRQRLRAAKGEHPWLALDDQALLEKLGGWRHDRETGQTGITLAGLLMFGKSEPIRDPAAAPRFLVDYREKLDPNVRWSDREHPEGTWEGNLFQFYQRVWPKLIKGLPVPFQLEDGRRRDETPVHEALREAFVNALVHADYSAPGGVVVERYPDRFVFENPGTLLLSREQFWRGGLSECRNKALQQMFFMMGGGDRAGSGVDKIKAGWKSQHWRAPILDERQQPDRVSLTLPMVSLIPEATMAELRSRLGSRFTGLRTTALQALATAHLEGSVSNQRLQQLVDEHPSDITQLLAGLCERGLLVSDGRRRWTRYQLPWLAGSRNSPDNSLNSPVSSQNSAANSQNSPSFTPLPGWANLVEIAAPIARKAKAPRKEVQQTILQLCRGRFLSLSQLSDLLHRKPESLRGYHVRQLLEEKRLQTRHPEPNHPDQAYTSAETPGQGSRMSSIPTP